MCTYLLSQQRITDNLLLTLSGAPAATIMQIPIFWRRGFVGITGGNGDRALIAGPGSAPRLMTDPLPVTVMIIASTTQRMFWSSLCLFCLHWNTALSEGPSP